MRIFVYEHITAHGLARDPGSPKHSLFVEGRAMFHAIRDDFAAIPGVEVLTGTPEEFPRLAASADWSVVIAPETDGVLLKLASEVERVGGRLLGPSPAAIALTSDKFALYQHWQRRGVPTPATVLVPDPPPGWPCVVKRRDGAGSEGMKLVESAAEYRTLSGSIIAQPFCAGTPASIVFLVGGSESIPLPATFQCISADGQFRYGGGLIPISPALQVRAEMLALRALEQIPGLLGYVGVDLLLGEAADGTEDSAIEINPRLTTSYVGVRASQEVNLAEMMLDLASRRREPTESGSEQRLRRLPPPARRVAFSASGNIRVDPYYDFWADPSEFSQNRTFFS